jgi:cytochrome c553
MKIERNFAVAILGIAALIFSLVSPALAEDAYRGAELFQLCAQCHGNAAEGNREIAAPAIAGLDQWYIEAQLTKFREGLRGAHPEDLPGLRMRPMAITLLHEGDVPDVAAYVASLPAVRPLPVFHEGDASMGKAYFNLCATCHGPKGAGNQQMNAPPLNKASDWYLLKQLNNFKAGIRGANPKDASGALMRPMAMSLPDEKAMKDVIAFIMALPQ